MNICILLSNLFKQNVGSAIRELHEVALIYKEFLPCDVTNLFN